MSKRLFLLLTLLAILTLVASCGGDTGPAPESAPAEAKAPAEATLVEEAAEAIPAAEEAPAEVAPTEAAAEAAPTAKAAPVEEKAEVAPTEEETPAKAAPAEKEVETAPAEAEPPPEEAVSEQAAGLGDGAAPAAVALTARAAYDLALAEAQAWQPDAVLVSMGASALGAVDAEGRSESWTLSFWAPAANEVNSMIFINGTLNATPLPNTGFPKPIPAMDAVTLDTKRIYDIAAAAGGSQYIAEGYNVSPNLTTYPVDENIPTWYVHYSDPASQAVVFIVIIDARSGEVIQTTATQ